MTNEEMLEDAFARGKAAGIGYAANTVRDAAEAMRLEAENARLRAALETIAALQVEEPVDNVRCGYDAYADGHDDGWSQGRYEAAELARAALGGGR